MNLFEADIKVLVEKRLGAIVCDINQHYHPSRSISKALIRNILHELGLQPHNLWDVDTTWQIEQELVRRGFLSEH